MRWDVRVARMGEIRNGDRVKRIMFLDFIHCLVSEEQTKL